MNSLPADERDFGIPHDKGCKWDPGDLNKGGRLCTCSEDITRCGCEKPHLVRCYLRSFNFATSIS